MKKLIIIILAAIALVFWINWTKEPETPEPQEKLSLTTTPEVHINPDDIVATHIIDVTSSTLTWSGSLVIGNRTHTGLVPIRSSKIMVTDGMIEQGVVVFSMDQLTGDNRTLTDDLKSKNFFETDKYPTATITIADLLVVGGGEYQLLGDLTVHGVTNHIEVPVTIAPRGKNFEVTSRFTISREKYGIDFRSIGDNAIEDAIGIDLNFWIIPLK